MKNVILILMVLGLTGCAGQVSDVMEGFGKGVGNGTPPVCHKAIASEIRSVTAECGAPTCADMACMEECIKDKAEFISPAPQTSGQ